MRPPHGGMRNRRLTPVRFRLVSAGAWRHVATRCHRNKRTGMVRVSLSLAGAGVIFYLLAFQFSNMFA